MSESRLRLRTILYARKSSDREDRQVLSIDSQVRELQDLASSEGLEIVQVVTESGSAKAPGTRPVFSSVVRTLETDEADVLLVWNPNRLSRNSVDSGRLIYLMDEGKLARIVTPSQTFANNPSDKFLLGLLCGQAKLENDNKRLAVLRGMNAKLKAGWLPTRAPIGYLNDTTSPKGLRRIHLDPERAPLVRRAFEAVLAGVPPKEVLRRANEQWGLRTRAGRPLAKSTLYRMLARPFYYGEFEFPVGSGQWHKGAHEPLITRRQFQEVQRLLGKGGRPRGKERTLNFPYKGLLRCGECGGAMTAEKKVKRQKNGNVHRYTYYHCVRASHPHCTQGSVEVKTLERHLRTFLKQLTLPEELHQWALEQLDKEDADRDGRTEVHLASLERASVSCTRKLDRLLELHLGSDVDAETFRRKSAELKQEKRRLQVALEEATEQAGQMNGRKESLGLCAEALDRFASGDGERKRAVLTALVSNLWHRDRTLLIEPKKSTLRILELCRQSPGELLDDQRLSNLSSVANPKRKTPLQRRPVSFGDPTGNRTPISRMKTWRPNH